VEAIAKFALILMSASTWNLRSLHAWQTANPPSTASSNDSKSPHGLNPPHGSGKVAIAWLSDVKGEVQLANSIGTEFQPAHAHTPVTEGNVIQTVMGRAEVEFDDNSALRLGPYSSVQFHRLELLPSGARTSNVSVLKGTVYVSIIPAYIVKTHWDDFQLMFGQQLLHYSHPVMYVWNSLQRERVSLCWMARAGSMDRSAQQNWQRKKLSLSALQASLSPPW